MRTVTCMICMSRWVALSGPERTGRVEAATESACDNLRNRAHARSASIDLASNGWAVTCCGRVQPAGVGCSTNVRISANLQLCHWTGARGSIALLNDVGTRRNR